MTSKVERLAAMVDDKTLISTLIREGSERINLIEFKDARADIWQHFRLVQLDGETLAYAVCVRCLKPVSYKAREGTGGLHRHPCSKAAIVHQNSLNLLANTSSRLPPLKAEADLSSESCGSPSPPPLAQPQHERVDVNFNASLSNMSRLIGLARDLPRIIEGHFMFANGSPRTDCHAMTLLGDQKKPTYELVAGMRSMFERRMLLDLTIVARNGSARCHRVVFASASRVTESMVTGTRIDELELSNYDQKVVKSMIEYLYYGQCRGLSNDGVDVIDLMKLSEELDLSSLKFTCAQHLYKKLSPENAIELLSIADKFNCDELKELIPLFVAENAERVTSSSAWRETFKERSDLVAHLLNVTAQEMTGVKRAKTS